MLYRIGTGKELLPLQGKVPDAVMKQLRYCIDVLDEAYGADREYLHSGGYCLLAETKDDLPGICEIMDLDSYPHEWVKPLDGDYLSALYLLGDDFSIVVFLPRTIAPTALRKELEDVS